MLGLLAGDRQGAEPEGTVKPAIFTSTSLQTEEMSSSSLHLSLSLMCLLVAVGVISCGRSHMVLTSALEGPHDAAAGEEAPDSFSIPEIQWMLRNSELAPVQVDEPLQSRMELIRRDSPVTAKPLNCMNYFWKSRTAC